MSHLRMAADCSWWLKERDILLNRRAAKGKGPMKDSANAIDYVLVPDLYAQDDLELESLGSDTMDPGDALQEVEDEVLFHLIPGVPPEPKSDLKEENMDGLSQHAESSQAAQPRKTYLSLDDDEDTRVVNQHPTAARVVKADQKLRDRWKAAFGKADEIIDTEGDVNMEEVSEDINPYAPFASELDWKIAKWFVDEDPGHAAFDRLLKIPGVIQKLGLSFKNVRGIRKTIEKIPSASAKWKSKVLRYADRPEEKFIIRYRDPVEVIRDLVGDPSLADDLHWAPSKVYSDMQREKRVYSEMWTADWWYKLQVCSVFLYCL